MVYLIHLLHELIYIELFFFFFNGNFMVFLFG